MKDLKTSYYLQEMEKNLKELISTSSGRRAFLKAAPLMLAACASTPKTRYREGDNSGQAAALTVAEERKMTAEVMPKMRKDYPPVRDAQMQRYISSLGRKIVDSNGLQGKPYNYNFTVVNVGYVNAFALPAGTVMITAPLIAMAETEAELSGVIGHEIGHIQARHTAERMFTAKKAQKKSIWYTLGGGLVGAAAGYGLGQLVCPPKDQKCMTKAASMGVAAGAMGGMLIQKYAFMANSREDEMEADRIGFRTSTKAGYHKDYVGRFYEKLLRMEQERKRGGNALTASIADAMSTHPPSRERVTQMREMAAQSSQKGKVSSATFQKMQARAKAYKGKAKS